MDHRYLTKKWLVMNGDILNMVDTIYYCKTISNSDLHGLVYQNGHIHYRKCFTKNGIKRRLVHNNDGIIETYHDKDIPRKLTMFELVIICKSVAVGDVLYGKCYNSKIDSNYDYAENVKGHSFGFRAQKVPDDIKSKFKPMLEKFMLSRAFM